MAGNGGARAGSGRKPGIPDRATAQREARIRLTGDAPLDCMIRSMRWWLWKADKLERQGTGEGFDRTYPKDKAAGIDVEAEIDLALAKAMVAASEAAPYIHPKFSAIAVASVNPDESKVQDTFVMLVKAFEAKANSKMIEATADTKPAPSSSGPVAAEQSKVG